MLQCVVNLYDDYNEVTMEEISSIVYSIFSPPIPLPNMIPVFFLALFIFINIYLYIYIYIYIEFHNLIIYIILLY